MADMNVIGVGLIRESPTHRKQPRKPAAQGMRTMLEPPMRVAGIKFNGELPWL
jgi:hypothetical protein